MRRMKLKDLLTRTVDPRHLRSARTGNAQCLGIPADDMSSAKNGREDETPRIPRPEREAPKPKTTREQSGSRTFSPR